MPKTRRITTMLLPALVLSVPLIGVPSAQAADTSPTVNPSSVAEGSSPAMTFTWTVSNPAPGRVVGVGLEGFSIARDRTATVTLAGNTVTCDFGSGDVVTWTSAGFTAGSPGSLSCDLYTWSDGNVYLDLPLFGVVDLSPGTVTLQVPAGVLQAPATPGSYNVTGYVWNGSAYVDYGATSITVGNVASDTTTVDEPRAWTVLRQGVPMPDSGDCADVVDEHLGWGTGVSGGWQRAWEPWAGQSGAGGGWACIRALVNRTGHHWSADNTAL